MIKTIYLNLEDDIAKITARLKKERAESVVLVFPKRSFLFSDSINLRLLKKQIDLLGKEVSVMTMDERGKIYAEEAGFKLRFLPKIQKKPGFSDVKMHAPRLSPAHKPVTAASVAASSIKEIKKLVKQVVPAGLAAPAVSVTQNVFSDLSEKVKGSNLHAKHRQKSKKYSRAIFGFVALALVVIVLLVAVILPKADVIVYARTEPVARDIEISLSSKIDAPDSDKLVMPATLVDRTLELRDKFSATGKRDVGNKAEGSVAIYNLTGRAINLKAATTTLTLAGKNYFFKTDQTQIKPAKEAGGQAPVNVADIVADQGGDSYNLPAGTRLEITNQVFGSHPQQLYAKTQTEINGGTSRFISFITPEDIQKSQVSLTAGIVKQLTDELAGKNLVMPDGAFTSNVLQSTTDKQAGAESPNFEGYENLHITAMAFDKQVLSALIRQRITKTLGDNKNLQDAGLDSLSYTLKSADFSNQVMTVSVHFESQVLSKVDASELKPLILGKTKQEASEILLSKPEVSRVDITLSPVWQKSLPRLSSKTRLEIK